MSDASQKKIQPELAEPDATVVHVVAGNYPDDPHPHVEAVYDNEDAAERHMQAITDSNSISAPVAWIKYEMEIRSDIGDCPVCGSDADRRVIEHKSSIIGDRERCPDCHSKVEL